MAEGRSKDAWQHTSAILALIANVNRDPKKTKAYKPSEFNPMLTNTDKADAVVITNDNVSILRKAFTGK